MSHFNMLFSIIIPVYKTQAYLERCVESVRKQTYKNIEIILVDDGSPDDCPQMCNHYSEVDSRIKVIHKAHSGLSDTRNAGLACAAGDYVLFVDSDDYIEYNTCESFISFVEKGYDILVGDAYVEGLSCGMITRLPSSHVFSGAEYYKCALKAHKVSPSVAWINVYRRAFLSDNHLFFKHGILSEDIEFVPRAFLAAQTVVCTHCRFYHYWIRTNSITTQKDKRENLSCIYATGIEHEKRFASLADAELKHLLMDAVVRSYLYVFQEGKSFKYGSEYIHRDFVLRNAYEPRTRIKASVFWLSPCLYWYIIAALRWLREHICGKS